MTEKRKDRLRFGGKKQRVKLKFQLTWTLTFCKRALVGRVGRRESGGAMRQIRKRNERKIKINQKHRVESQETSVVG